MSRILSGSAFDMQMMAESAAIDDGIRRYMETEDAAIRRGEGASLPPSEQCMVWWYPQIRAAIEDEQAAVQAGVPGHGREVYGPAVLLLPPDRGAVVVMHAAMSRLLQEPDGCKVADVAHHVGAAWLGEAAADLMRQGHKDAWHEMQSRCRNAVRPRHTNRWLRKNFADPTWSRRVTMYLGSHLLAIFRTLPAAKWVPPQTPAPCVDTKLRREGGRDVGYMSLNRDLVQQLADMGASRARIASVSRPMFVAPMEWVVGTDGKIEQEGGYIRIRKPLIANITREHRRWVNQNDMTEPVRLLNEAAKVPWRLNLWVLGAMYEIEKRGGGIAGIPRLSKIEKPPLPPDFDTNLNAKREWKKAAKQVYKQNVELLAEQKVWAELAATADRCAEHHFFQPLRFDSRGRVYTLSQSLTHYSGDLHRGLLLAGTKAPLGDYGLSWIKVQAANVAGKDQGTFDERVAWVDRWCEQHRPWEWIADAVKTVNAAEATWAHKDIESPFQFLAALTGLHFEDIARSLPVQWDGVANGLQHYAAIGRDPNGAAVVGMDGRNERADPYRMIAEQVRRRIQQDKDNESPVAITVRGKVHHFRICDLVTALSDIVTRKVTKPVVMRRVYGVTGFGARNAVNEHFLTNGYFTSNQAERYAASQYLTTQILAAVGEVCVGAREIMDWLSELAREIAATGETVRWINPIGFPVLQSYRQTAKRQIRTTLQYLTIVVEDDRAPVNVRKQRTAFPPNWIHSIDSAHALATVDAARKRGLWCATVHDSFWALAGQSNEMHQIIRDEFIRLHERPLMDELIIQLRGSYPKAKLPDPPARGSYDLELVRRSPYMFH